MIPARHFALVLLGSITPALPLQAAPEVVTPTSVTSLTAPSDFFPVENLIDGSGLPNLTLTPENLATVTHAVASRSTAWVTADPAPGGGDWYAEGNPDPVLTFTLPGTYDITAAVLWGYHFGQLHNNEAKSFTAEFSADAGETWHTPQGFVHDRSAADNTVHTFPLTVRANAVRLTITDNHFGAAGIGGGDRVGLGEVRFLGTPFRDPVPVVSAPTSHDFGVHELDPGTLQVEIPIANNGPELPLTIQSATLTGPHADQFSLGPLPAPVPAGTTAPLTVTFDAAATIGCFTATLDIATDDPATPVTTVLLTAAVGCIPAPPEPPTFSRAPSTFSTTFDLSLTSATPGATLVYTTDGSLPSATNGTPYTAPLEISATTQVRAAALTPGQDPSVASATYVRLAPDLAAYTSPLPVLVVENFAAGRVPDKGWSTSTQTGAGLQQRHRQPASLLVLDTDPETGQATLTQPPSRTSRIGIRVRGAFSSTWNPKPYSVETWHDDRDEDDKIKLLGMPSDSDWILYYPHPDYDRSMLFNTFIWELGSQCGRYGTRFRFVDVFINTDGGDLRRSDRVGVYALAEKVKRSADRIDFEPLSEDGTTGGWLLSVNRMDAVPPDGFPAENGATRPQFFHTPGPDRILQTPPNTAARGDDIPRQSNGFLNFENPNGYRINPTQRQTIESWFATFENTFFDDSKWLDPVDGYRQFVDTQDLATYFLLLNLARQSDGLLISVFPWVSSGDRQLHMGPMWDFNNGVYDRAGNPRTTKYFRSDRLWYRRLFQDPSWERELRDRWFELRQGPLSNANMAALIDRQAATVTTAMANAQGIPTNTWNGRLTAMKNFLHQRADWLDGQYFAPPQFDLPPANVPRGINVTLTDPTNARGTLFLTADGTDPATSPTATDVTDTPFAILETAILKARTRNPSGEWSALATATYTVGPLASRGNLAVSEIHYNPAGPSEDTEFIELLNTSNISTIQLTGVTLSGAVTFTFPVGSALAPGARILVVKNLDAFTATYGDGLPVAGTYTGNLRNSGETLTVTAANTRTITGFTYADDLPWPTAPDGDGPSLVAVVTGDPNNPTHWRPSTTNGGNPGTSDALPPFTGDPLADPDHDTLPDLLEHALGTDPAVPDPHPLKITRTTLTFTHAANADDTVLTLEASPDLKTWTPVPTPQLPLDLTALTHPHLRLRATQR